MPDQLDLTPEEEQDALEVHKELARQAQEEREKAKAEKDAKAKAGEEKT